MSQPPVVGSFKLMKSLNRSLILNTIREKGGISRADIAKLTKLTPPTVSNLVKELIESEIIIEGAQGVSRGGRKATMLTINIGNFFIIGLDVGPKHIKGGITDLNAHMIECFKVDIPENITNDGLLSLMEENILKLISKKSISRQNIIGIGVGMHGIVDVEHGISLFAPNLGLRDVPIKEHLEKKFEMAVKVENDARAMALGETWFGSGSGVNSSVFINVGRGIGGGIILNGKLHHGKNCIGGEIGHMTINIDGPLCSCGNHGCLQAFATGPRIVERAVKEIAIGKESLLMQMTNGKPKNISGELIYEAAKQGDTLSRKLLYETGRYLGLGLTNLIHIINPERIVIGGGVSQSGHFILNSLKKTVEERAIVGSAKKTDIFLSELEDDATVIGAVSLMLVELFST